MIRVPSFKKIQFVNIFLCGYRFFVCMSLRYLYLPQEYEYIFNIFF